MDTKKRIVLDYPEEFRIACKINNLKHEELLQYFIDHVSFYAFIGGNIGEAYRLSTTVCIECKDEYGKKSIPVTDIRIQEVSLKYIKKLTTLSSEPGLDQQLETARSIDLMRGWALEMLPLTEYQTRLDTEMGEILYLTFDFNLLCRVNGIDIIVLLQYFIDHISLARERAVNFHQEIKLDSSTALLLVLVASDEKIKDRILPHQAIYRQYGLSLLKLDKKQITERNLEKRLSNYHNFYREWYDALIKNIN